MYLLLFKRTTFFAFCQDCLNELHIDDQVVPTKDSKVARQLIKKMAGSRILRRLDHSSSGSTGFINRRITLRNRRVFKKQTNF